MRLRKCTLTSLITQEAFTDNRNTTAKSEICSKLTIKTPKGTLVASFWCIYC